MKIQLISPSPPEEYLAYISRWAVPLGLLSIATCLKQTFSSLEIEILDGEILPQSELEKRIKADIVGISSGFLSHSRAIRLGELAKQQGSLVVFGGVYSSCLPIPILKNNHFIDAVVVGPGEEALCALIKEKSFKEIPGLVYQEKGEIKRNPPAKSSSHLINRSFLDLEPYFQNYQQRNPHSLFKRPTNIHSIGGCSYRKETGGCLFCAIPPGSRSQSPEQTWQEIGYLVQTYAVDYIHDCSDNLTGEKEWLKKFHAQRPVYYPYFKIYSRLDNLDKSTIQKLAELKIHEVFVGLESGDPQQVEKLGKSLAPANYLSSIKLLTEYGIKLHPALVLGSPGETKESLDNTKKLIENITKITTPINLGASILLPLPGSRAYHLLLQKPELRKKYFHQDQILVEELKRDWVSHFCSIDYDTIQKTLTEILAMVPFSYGMGVKK